MTLELVGEHHAGMVSGIFCSEAEAKNAVESLVKEGDFESSHIDMVAPDDKEFEKKIEPESDGVGTTLFKSHIILGATGFLAGLLMAAFFTVLGPKFIQSSPMFSTIAFGLIGLFLGLIVAGVITLRPDHDGVINDTRQAIRSGLWAVVVHTADREEMYRAKIMMSGSAKSLSETF